MLVMILLVAAIICYLFAAFGVRGNVDWVSLGHAFVVGAVLAWRVG